MAGSAAVADLAAWRMPNPHLNFGAVAVGTKHRLVRLDGLIAVCFLCVLHARVFMCTRAWLPLVCMRHAPVNPIPDAPVEYNNPLFARMNVRIEWQCADSTPLPSTPMVSSSRATRLLCTLSTPRGSYVVTAKVFCSCESINEMRSDLRHVGTDT